jgi:hypothetical protein
MIFIDFLLPSTFRCLASRTLCATDGFLRTVSSLLTSQGSTNSKQLNSDFRTETNSFLFDLKICRRRAVEFLSFFRSFFLRFIAFRLPSSLTYDNSELDSAGITHEKKSGIFNLSIASDLHLHFHFSTISQEKARDELHSGSASR